MSPQWPDPRGNASLVRRHRSALRRRPAPAATLAERGHVEGGRGGGAPARSRAPPSRRSRRGPSRAGPAPARACTPFAEERSRARARCRSPGAGSRPRSGSVPAALRGCHPRPAPVGLQHLVRLEEEPGVEEQGRRLQRVASAPAGRAKRRRRHRGARPAGTRDDRAALVAPRRGEPVGHGPASHARLARTRRAAGSWSAARIVSASRLRAREATGAAGAIIPRSEARRAPWPAPGPRRPERRAPRGCPARRSCRARLSRRRPAMAKPRPKVPSEAKYPMKRRNAAPMERHAALDAHDAHAHQHLAERLPADSRVEHGGVEAGEQHGEGPHQRDERGDLVDIGPDGDGAPRSRTRSARGRTRRNPRAPTPRGSRSPPVGDHPWRV